MRPVNALLGVMLGVSLLVNLLTIPRLATPNGASAPRPSPGRTSASPDPARSFGADEPQPAGPDASAQLDAIRRELVQLRSEIAALRGGSSSVPATTPAVLGGLGDGPPRDAELAAILDEQTRVNSFWADLGKLSAARQELGAEKSREAVLELTAEFAGLTGTVREQFAASARLAAQDLERAQREFDEARKGIAFDRSNPQLYQEAWKNISNRYQEARRQAGDRLKSSLDPNQPRQKALLSRFDMWLNYLSTPQWGGQWGNR